MFSLKITAHVNGVPIEDLTKEQRAEFEKHVARCLENKGYKLHKKKVTK